MNNCRVYISGDSNYGNELYGDGFRITEAIIIMTNLLKHSNCKQNLLKN